MKKSFDFIAEFKKYVKCTTLKEVKENSFYERINCTKNNFGAYIEEKIRDEYKKLVKEANLTEQKYASNKEQLLFIKGNLDNEKYINYKNTMQNALPYYETQQDLLNKELMEKRQELYIAETCIHCFNKKITKEQALEIFDKIEKEKNIFKQKKDKNSAEMNK